MHILGLTTPINFNGKRENRNLVSKLSKDNDFSLNEMNQRKINQAIEDLASINSESNVKFLLNTAENLKYGTNIQSPKKSRNDWSSKLNTAVTDAIKGLPEASRKKYETQADKVFNGEKALTPEENRILENKEKILGAIDKKALAALKDKNERNLESNLEYFIVSSETTTKQKDYVLDRLAYFMSDDYKINPQLKDKKTEVLAEMVNDLVITTPESETPNIKSVNQRSHGMCADISISRKALAYEDKPNYVDAILSELDDTPFVMVYDRTNLGSKKRVPVQKASIDYDYATAKGYRIVDASCLQWMQIAEMFGANNEVLQVYNAFDKENFDVYHDAFFNAQTDDENFAKEHGYYQALVKAKEVIGDVKAGVILNNEKDSKIRKGKGSTIDEISKYSGSIRKSLENVMPDADSSKINSAFNSVVSLEVKNSEKIDKDTSDIKQYKYIPNEESTVKKDKIKGLLQEKYNVDTDADLLDKTADKLLDLTGVYNGLLTKTNTNSIKQTPISRAKKLYSAEAAYRNQFIKGLQVPEIRNYYMSQMDIADTESEVLNGFDYLLGRLEKDDNNQLTNILAKAYNVEPNREEIMQSIASMGASYEDMITNGLDAMYGMILNGSRTEVLKNNIELYKDAVANDPNNGKLQEMAELLKVAPDKESVTAKLTALQEDLADENNYLDVFNALGMKSQLDTFDAVYQPMKMFILSSEDMRQAFNECNGLKPNASKKETMAIFDNIDKMYGILSEMTEQYQNMFEIKDEHGKELYPIRPEKVIVSSMERTGDLIPSRTMEKLRDRFTKIDYVKNEDHMNGNRGKISDKSLLQLSREEKEALNKISKDLNKKYAEVNRGLTNQFKKIESPLKNLKRYIGLNSGMYWVQPEGSSGLFSGPQVKIFEQLTDRPYHNEENNQIAVNKMKSSDFSGISTTSVSSTFPGMHAQYVADIVSTNINGEMKDVLYHDNTWGACEDENTWTDSTGLKRTDYACGRGGDLGYVTNDRLFNGNIVENMMKKGHSSSQEVESKQYRKLKGEGGSFNFDMFTGAIVSGKNHAAENIVSRIKDNCFTSSIGYMKSLEEQASQMTKAELLKSFERIEHAGSGYKTKYDAIKKQIDSDNKIHSEEDFNNILPLDNKIRLSLEKVALRQSLYNYGLMDTIATAKTQDDLNNIKQKQIDIVNEKFDYAFAKNKNITKYITKTHQQESIDVIDNIFKQNQMDIGEKTLIAILDSADNISDKDFDGSLSDTIDTMCANVVDAVSTKVPDVKIGTLEALSEGLNKYMHVMLDFNSSDMNIESNSFKKIKEIIDRKYDPETNGEFIKIYKSLQNMTKEEFDKEMSDVTLEDKGLKNVTAYDVFQKIKKDNDATKSELKNSIFYEEITKDMKFSDTITNYQYEKFSKNTNGMFYKNGERTFDDIYRDFYFSMSSMEMDKLARSMFDSGYRQYGVFPAFPSVEIMDKDSIYEHNNSILNQIVEIIANVNNYKDIFELVNLSDNLAIDKEVLEAKQNLTADDYKTSDEKLARIADILKEEPMCVDLVKNINTLLSAEDNDKVKNSKVYISTIDDVTKALNDYKYMLQGESIDNATATAHKSIKTLLNEVVSSDIILRHVPRVNKDINKWLKAEFDRKPEAKELFDTVADDLYKYSKLNYPTEVLKEYICSKAKDNQTNYGKDNTLQAYCKNILSLANVVEMQEILMDIVSSGDMSSVKKQLHEKTVEFTGKDGSELIYTMDSDEVLSAMVDSLMLTTDISTAVMFTEKLGITDRMVKLQADSVDFDKCYKSLNRLEKTVLSQKKQYDIISNEFLNQIQSIDENNYSEVIDSIKDSVNQKTKNLKYKYTTKKFNEVMDIMKNQLETDKQTPFGIIVEGYGSLLPNIPNEICASKIQSFNDSISTVSSIYNFINLLYIPEYSDSYKTKEDFVNKYTDLATAVQGRMNKALGRTPDVQ